MNEFRERSDELLRQFDRNTRQILASLAVALFGGMLAGLNPLLGSVAFACGMAAFVLALRDNEKNHREWLENSRLWNLRIRHKIDQWQAAQCDGEEWKGEEPCER